MVDVEQWKLPPLSQKSDRSEINPLKGRGENEQKKMYQGKMSKSEAGPFSIPTDEEVLRYYEKEREMKNEAKSEIANSKIWDKMTFSHRHQLRHYKDFQVELDDTHKSKTSFSDGQKKLIQRALSIAKQRQTAPPLNYKESVTDLLEQKKEMFLVTMSHDIISGEVIAYSSFHNINNIYKIVRLQKQTEERDLALHDSEKMLKQDYDNFQKFLERNKQKRVEAESKADQANRQKRMKEAQIKELNLKLTTIRAEKAKNEEILTTMKEHKEFLDKLVPKEWEEEKYRKRQQLINELRAQYFGMSSELVPEKATKISMRGKKDLLLNSNVDKNKPLVQKSDAIFNQMIKNEELPELDDFENAYPMYFQDPSQLQDFFNTLEEKNLFLMQMKQEDEQNFEELKHNSKIEKQFLNNKSRVLQDQKDQLKKQIEEMNQAMKNMKQSSDERIIKDNETNENKLAVLIEDLYNSFKDEIGLHSQDKEPTLSVLSSIENLFERLFKDIKGCPIKLVEEKRKAAEKDRKQEQRDAQNERKKEENQRRNEKNRIKMIQSVKKRNGRLDMMRSAPFQKEGSKEVKDNLSQEDEDTKYFREDYKLL